MQNNPCASIPSVITFGSPPGGSANLLSGNTVDVRLDRTESASPICHLGIGFDSFTAEPVIDACQQGAGTTFVDNCCTVVDPTDDVGFGVCLQTQKELAVRAANNDCNMGSSPTPAGNAGVVNLDTSASEWSGNRFSGAGDFCLLTLGGSEHDNLFTGNQCGLGDLSIPLFVVLDVGVGPNLYDGTQYCDGDLIGGIQVSSQDGLFCIDGPAHPCAGPALPAVPPPASPAPGPGPGAARPAVDFR